MASGIASFGELHYRFGVVIPGAATHVTNPVRDHSFHRLRVGRVVRETADTSSFVLDIPEDLRPAFAYEAGQFCTFKVWVDGKPVFRCYSMSSAPAVVLIASSS